jgi:hypothetical protein
MLEHGVIATGGRFRCQYPGRVRVGQLNFGEKR